MAEATRFLVADVTRLPELGLRRCAFALDIGCFHGLSAAGQARYVEGLAATLLPGGRYMLYTLDPRQQAGVAFGLLPAQVAAVFAARFTLRRQERGGFGARGSTWYWMERKE